MGLFNVSQWPIWDIFVGGRLFQLGSLHGLDDEALHRSGSFFDELSDMPPAKESRSVPGHPVLSTAQTK
jgi:hypothetical protein